MPVRKDRMKAGSDKAPAAPRGSAEDVHAGQAPGRRARASSVEAFEGTPPHLRKGKACLLPGRAGAYADWLKAMRPIPPS